MSKIGNIILDVQDRLVNSGDDFATIAREVGVSVEWVRRAAAELESENEDYSPYQTVNS